MAHFIFYVLQHKNNTIVCTNKKKAVTLRVFFANTRVCASLIEYPTPNIPNT